jgi:hypothetical protein
MSRLLAGSSRGARATAARTFASAKLPKRLNGRLGRLDIDDLDCIGGPGQREHALDVRGPAQEHQPTAGLPRADAGADDRVHAGASP